MSDEGKLPDDATLQELINLVEPIVKLINNDPSAFTRAGMLDTVVHLIAEHINLPASLKISQLEDVKLCIWMKTLRGSAMLGFDPTKPR